METTQQHYHQHNYGIGRFLDRSFTLVAVFGWFIIACVMLSFVYSMITEHLVLSLILAVAGYVGFKVWERRKA